MLLLKPKGRGNWATATMAIESARLAPLLVRVGATFELGGVLWRVCKVLP